MSSPPTPKPLATITSGAPTIEEVARELAITIATALDGNGHGAILVGPATAIMDDGATLGPHRARCSRCKSSRPSRST